MRGINRLKDTVAKIMRRVVLSITILGLLFSSAPVYAAVPTYVVEFEINTKFERSLEKFLFDLFNTLQRREEDFTAAFELQKIEKAREDVNKLFQETQEELLGFGLAFAPVPSFLPTQNATVRDPRLNNDGTAHFPNDCKETSSGGEPPGCTPTISPIKDSRIIHDPYQYLFGDATVKAQLYAYCYYNYLVWDQWGLLGDRYDWLQEGFWRDEKQTYDPTGESTAKSVKVLLGQRDDLIPRLARGSYYELNNPFHEIYGNLGNVDNKTSVRTRMEIVEPKCRQVMYVVGMHSPVTVEQRVNTWITLRTQDGISPTPEAVNYFRRSLLKLPRLRRGVVLRSADNPPSWYEQNLAHDQENKLGGISEIVGENIETILSETETERKATYIAGQGIRPENLYQIVTGGGDQNNRARFDLNTEYVIAPAATLLQKMQAATQAQFDLAGQGFLYLDPVKTPEEVLGAYKLTSNASNEEARKICNNAGACQLLDAWLKPTATFRSVATLELEINKTDPKIPQTIGAEGDYPGAGLSAPWEDEGKYLKIANEKNAEDANNRYTVGRFLNNNQRRGKDGEDEFNDAELNINSDNIGSSGTGDDYPMNDWYDRVTEMYESGIGVSGGSSLRGQREKQFVLGDWQCYIGRWFHVQSSKAVKTSSSYGGVVSFFYGQKRVVSSSPSFTSAQRRLFNQYCTNN